MRQRAKTLWLSSMFVPCLFVMACTGSSSSSPSPASPNTGTGANGTANPSATTTWNNTAMQSLVQTSCAVGGCHDGTVPPLYAGVTESAMRADTAALSAVQRRSMPRNSSLTSAQLATFTNFYAK